MFHTQRRTVLCPLTPKKQSLYFVLWNISSYRSPHKFKETTRPNEYKHLRDLKKEMWTDGFKYKRETSHFLYTWSDESSTECIVVCLSVPIAQKLLRCFTKKLQTKFKFDTTTYGRTIIVPPYVVVLLLKLARLAWPCVVWKINIQHLFFSRETRSPSGRFVASLRLAKTFQQLS